MNTQSVKGTASKNGVGLFGLARAPQKSAHTGSSLTHQTVRGLPHSTRGCKASLLMDGTHLSSPKSICKQIIKYFQTN